MKLHRHRRHHDVKKLTRLITQRALPVGVSLYQLDICHDGWCRIDKGRPCNGDPDLRLKAVWTPRPRLGRHDMIGVEVREGYYFVTLPTCVLVLTKAEFVQALRRGQWWRRPTALAARRRRLGEGG
jgi:hypothetical protein